MAKDATPSDATPVHQTRRQRRHRSQQYANRQYRRAGHWEGRPIGLIGGQNHSKIGVTTSGSKHYAIFGDLNQQGTINPPKCNRSQNGRDGMFSWSRTRTCSIRFPSWWKATASR